MFLSKEVYTGPDKEVCLCNMNIMKLLSGSSTMNIRAFMCKLGRQLGNKEEESVFSDK